MASITSSTPTARWTPGPGRARAPRRGAFIRGGVGHLDKELGAARAQDRRRSADAHGLGRLLDDLARYRRQRAAVQGRFERIRLPGRAEREQADVERAIRPERQQRVVLERDAGGA